MEASRRRLPQCPSPPTAGEPGRRPPYVVHVVTPLFGGGPDAGENDPVTLIRGSSIRGHLRFWWRATRGVAYGDARALREREGAVWGTTARRSPVSVEVMVSSLGRAVPCAWYDERGAIHFHKGYPSYALFPFKGKPPKQRSSGARPEEEPKLCREGVAFQLTLEYPGEYEAEVLPALWAWINFGGVGARTRRGCGSLWCEGLSPTKAGDIGGWYRSWLQRYGITPVAEPRPWPTLADAAALLVKPSAAGSPLEAWNVAVSTLQRFRQGEGVARNQGTGGRAGRSRWPEADSVRRMSTSAPEHAAPVVTVNGFPRAELGMPIRLHFKDAKRGDPPDTDILPVDAASSRMASPLIVKALALSPTAAVPIIMCLQAKTVSGVRVIVSSAKGRPARVEKKGADAIRNPVFAGYLNSPLRGRSPAGSALEAFLRYVREDFEGASAR